MFKSIENTNCTIMNHYTLLMIDDKIAEVLAVNYQNK